MSALLAEWIARQNLSVRAVETRLGWGHSGLTSAMKRNSLKFSAVAAVAEACGFDVRDFYRELADRDEKSPPQPPKTKPGRRRREVVKGVPEEDLMNRVRDVVRDWVKDQKKEEP